MELKVPGGDVVAFVNKHPRFFELVHQKGKTTKVRVKQHQSTSGYQWRMCTDFHFTAQCQKGQACIFWHGPGDLRNVPSKVKTAAQSTPATSQSQSKPAPPPAKKGQNKQKPAPKNCAPVVTIPKAVPPKIAPVAPTPTIGFGAPVVIPAPISSSAPPAKRHFEGKNCYLVPDEKNCGEVVVELMKQEIIAVDCEGFNLGANGKLCLIQIATNSNVYVFDMCIGTSERSTIINMLIPVFKNDDIKKVLHDARNDNEALHSVGLVNEHFEDTQKLHELLIKLRGKHETSIGLKELLKIYGFDHELKTTMKTNYRSDPALWTRRPLTEDMIEYAACDVVNLATVYNKLKEDIEKEIIMISKNYATPKPLKSKEKTYAEALKIQVDVELHLSFTSDKKPNRRNLHDVAPEGNPLNRKFMSFSHFYNQTLCLEQRIIRINRAAMNQRSSACWHCSPMKFERQSWPRHAALKKL